MYSSFRPLDGESISKQGWNSQEHFGCIWSFRPLDGESISKPIFKSSGMSYSTSFRPLDGESISKRYYTSDQDEQEGGVEFPSPRRGINF